MLVHPISFGAFENFAPIRPNTPNSTNAPDKTENKSKITKALPYIAGAVVLATSAFVFRDRIAKILKKTKIKEQPPQPQQPPQNNLNIEQNKNDAINTLPAVIYKFDFLPPKTAKIEKGPNDIIANTNDNIPLKTGINNSGKVNTAEANTPVISEKTDPESGFKIVCVGFKDGHPVFEKIELPVDNIEGYEDAFSIALNKSKLDDEAIINKIKNISSAQFQDIERIINENTHNGLINMPMMQKIANDFMTDLNRGPDRYHQAADIMEQSHIRQHIRGNRPTTTEMFNLVDYMTTDPILYKCYQNMPLEESANRLNLINKEFTTNEKFKEALETTKFFEKTFTKLVEKYQFKRYNLAHGIKD